MHILRRKHYEFIPAILTPGRYPLLVKGNFDTSGGTEYPTWKLTLTTSPGTYGKKDLEQPYELRDEAPEIIFYAAENYNGDKRTGGDKLIAKLVRGQSYVKWQEFCRMLIAMGVDPLIEGECQPRDNNVGIKSIWLDVHSKEANGDYPAKNYATDWAVNSEAFEAKRKARESALLSGMADAEIIKVNGGIDLDSKDSGDEQMDSKRRFVDFGENEEDKLVPKDDKHTTKSAKGKKANKA